jgi:O-antigen biosynthesis protein
MTVFAMVTTRHSNSYTNYALASLIEQTRFQPNDEIILIDNDGAYDGPPAQCRDRVRVRINEQPRSFAANLNQTIDAASGGKADVVFLNNDLIFSHNWFEPLRDETAFLLSPISNAEFPSDHGDLHCKLGMDLNDYLGKEHLFRDLVRQHQKRARGYLKALSVAFFAVKIPYRIYSVVGRLDESFGIGGGEDKDYCIRCYQRGFELRWAVSSYLLHFQGKSTWRGAETAEQTAARDRFYMERFKQKWGAALFDLLILNDSSRLPQELRKAFDQGDFETVINSLAPSRPG